MARFLKGVAEQSDSKNLAKLLLSILGLMLSSASGAIQSDSTLLLKQNVAAVADTSGTSCYFFAVDTYTGAELPSQGFTSGYYHTGPGWVAPPLANGSLSTSWSGGVNSPFIAGSLPCNGSYQAIFSLQLQATNSVNPIAVSPCVQTVDGSTLIYGACPAAAGGAKSFTFDPACNGGYYCGVITYYFAAKVTLLKGQMINPPSLFSNGPINITGGEFMLYYLGS